VGRGRVRRCSGPAVLAGKLGTAPQQAEAHSSRFEDEPLHPGSAGPAGLWSAHPPHAERNCSRKPASHHGRSNLTALVDTAEAGLPRTELDVADRRHRGPAAAARALLSVATAATPAEPPLRSGDGNNRYSLALHGIAECCRGSRRGPNSLGQVLGEPVPGRHPAGLLPCVSFGHRDSLAQARLTGLRRRRYHCRSRT
jgi:hypothetical protein